MLEMMCLKEKSLSLWRDNAHSSYLSKNALTVLPALNLYLRLATTKSELNPIENPLEAIKSMFTSMISQDLRKSGRSFHEYMKIGMVKGFQFTHQVHRK